MDVFETDKLFLFIAFVVPGFITYKTYELISASGNTDDFGTKIVDAIAYSCVNYSILSLPIYSAENSRLAVVHPQLYILFYVFVVFVFPVVLAFWWRKIRLSDFAQRNAPHPTLLPWDFVFSQKKPYFIVITLQNGMPVAGYYGSQSFASSYPAQPQIYLEKEWLLNESGGFDREVEGTVGILVIASEIKTINFFPG